MSVVLVLGAVLLLVSCTVHLLVGRFATGTVRAAAEVTVVAILALLVAYAVGLVATFPADWSDPCGEREGTALVRSDIDLFPLRHVCVWEDGERIDEVPDFVNPLVVALAGVSVAGFFVFVGASAHEAMTGRSEAGRRPENHELGSRRGSD
jgi:hypothetical protein